MVAAERIMAMLFAGDNVVQVVRGSPDPAPLRENGAQPKAFPAVNDGANTASRKRRSTGVS